MGKRKHSKAKNKYHSKANRKYKDRLFRIVFRNKSDLLDLYNAINGTDYRDVDGLEVNTLEDVVYLSFKNDMSFLIAGTVNLYEHQSSYNPNMPIRGLIYFARLYEKYMAAKGIDIYSSALKELPTPRYLVFYNGEREEKDEVELQLSDAFQKQDGEKRPCLECVATMININYGHNHELLEKCRRLEEYAIFVYRVREYVKAGGSLDASVNRAVDECVSDGILADILISQRAEVVSMILQMTWEEHERLFGKEKREEGREEGRMEGRRQGESLKLLSQIQKKCRKGKKLEVIAEELEEEVENIRPLYEAVVKHPDCSVEEIYQLLEEN